MRLSERLMDKTMKNIDGDLALTGSTSGLWVIRMTQMQPALLLHMLMHHLLLYRIKLLFTTPS